MVSDRQQQPRLPLDTATAKKVVDAGLVMVDRLLRGAKADEKVQGFISALRELHLDVAGAEFDSALPGKTLRAGGESIELPAAADEGKKG